ncbi:MAG: transcriptional regulator of arginine metabolism [Planctomycetota bacterium]|jgi:transcriptional regulator of arginine metabolism
MPALSHQQTRRQAILELLRQGAVPNQAHLAAALADQDLEANQATLSRDLRALGAIKGSAGYSLPGPGVEAPKAPLAQLRVALGQWCLGLEPAQQLLVMHTPPGGAQPMALALDHAGLGNLLGSIAGDDTVLLISPDPAAALALSLRLEELKP